MIFIEDRSIFSEDNMDFVIQGMRNPMNSWDRSDSYCCTETKTDDHVCFKCANLKTCFIANTGYIVGPNDMDLMKRLFKAGEEHRKFMRMMPVYLRITAPLYWWKEYDTYKIGTVANSCSTMHKIGAKEFTIDDFSHERLSAPMIDVLNYTIVALNNLRELYISTKSKDYWYQMIQLLPSSYNQTRNVMVNYEVLANIYKQRKDHKLDEWRGFCNYISTVLPLSFLITGEFEDEKDNKDQTETVQS